MSARTSSTVTCAPMPTAIVAALRPTTPPPRMTTRPRRVPGHAAEEHALAAALLLEARRADLHGHAPGDLAHRPEQRQRAVVELDRLVGDAGRRLLCASFLRELGLGGEVQVRVEDEALAEEAVLGGERLLHLHDHLGAPGVGRGRDDGRPLRHVLGVGDAAALAGARLDEHLVAARGEAAHAGRRHPHAVLARLDLLGDADDHGQLRR